MKKLRLQTITFILLFTFSVAYATQHPGIFLTSQSVKEIKKSIGKYPAFDKSYYELKAIADAALTKEIVVPKPKDGGGGYTHEKHKNNYYEMNASGMLYQITGEKKYAQFVLDMLKKYAEIYPTLGTHPAQNSETPGKLFWQALNEAVWLFHTANAYDYVYNFINLTDRTYIEKNLFYPMAEFISNGNANNYAVFNKMHNHGTWATASVGMIGYAMGDKDLVEKALYGSNKDGKAGFIRQLDVLFSPDGYFTEGPYYQRYAIWPFMTFAQVIQNQQPELNIFNYRDGILKKAVNTLIQSAYNGEIFYLNDALQKTYKTQEIVYAVDIAYKNDPTNKQLLDIARQQESFIISGEGLATAKAVSKEKINAFEFKSTFLRDGQNGDEGGIAIFRAGKGKTQTCLTYKATSHGLSHGHYDKLSIALFDNENSILPDYGAARFLNIEPKSGGGYTKENHTFASQTIAHNTVTVDERSHFDGNIKISSKFHSDVHYYDFSDNNLNIVCGSESNAYNGAKMMRTTALLSAEDFEFPVTIDIFKVQSDSIHTYDLPFYYRGQMVSTDFKYNKSVSELKTLGSHNGYQHLWLEASGKTNNQNANFTWVNGNRFYSITTLTNSNTELLMTRTGANDPSFNLRSETAFIIRQPKATNHSFVSIIEPHGLYDLSREITSGFKSIVTDLKLISENENYTVVEFSIQNGAKYIFTTINKDFDKNKKHTVTFEGSSISFTGNYNITRIKE